MSRKCGSLDVSHRYGLPWSVTETAWPISYSMKWWMLTVELEGSTYSSRLRTGRKKRVVMIIHFCTKHFLQQSRCSHVITRLFHAKYLFAFVMTHDTKFNLHSLQWFSGYYQHNTENITYICPIVVFNFIKMAFVICIILMELLSSKCWKFYCQWRNTQENASVYEFPYKLKYVKL
jgi:hypothetical protein